MTFLFQLKPNKASFNTLFKDIKIWAIIVIPLIMTLQGSSWADQKDSHNEVIMTFLQGQ